MSDPFEAQAKFDLAGMHVYLAMPVHREVSPATVRSLLGTKETLFHRGIPLTTYMGSGGSLVHHARSKLVHQFLQKDCTHLFWVDSDIDWEPEQFIRLLCWSMVMPIVCAAYPVKRDPAELQISPIAVGKPVETNEYGCVPIKGAGSGFVCFQRSVIEEMSAKAPLAWFPDYPKPIPYLYRCDLSYEDIGADGIPYARGEDMAFFADCRAAGHTVWLDPTISLGHIGPKTYRASLKPDERT